MCRRTIQITHTTKVIGDPVDLIERRNVLRRRIHNWVETQHIYMPSIAQLRLQTDSVVPENQELGDPDAPTSLDASLPPENLPLWLPSNLPEIYRTGDLTLKLLGMEQRLRLAQVEDSLSDIRRLRRIMRGISEFKRLNITGTGTKGNARVRDLYSSFERKQKVSVERYRAAYRALKRMDPAGSWSSNFRDLLDSDLTGPGRDPDDDVRGEGYRETSWIWLAGSNPSLNPNDPEEYDRSMRAEWAHNRARAHRWEEEVELLVEEMRRVIHFFEWRARWWTGRATLRAACSSLSTSSDVAEGVGAYALRQSEIFRQLATKFAHTWLPLLHSLDRLPAWADRYKTENAAQDSSEPPGVSNNHEEGSSDEDEEDEDDEDEEDDVEDESINDF